MQQRTIYTPASITINIVQYLQNRHTFPKPAKLTVTQIESNVRNFLRNKLLEIMYQSNRTLNTPPPRAYPGQLTSVAAREGGNLMNLVFPGEGYLITTHRGWGIWSLASISCCAALIPRGVINHGGDKPWCIQSERYPIRGGLAEKQRLAQALLCIWRY